MTDTTDNNNQLDLSPVIPVQPDWHELAVTLADAYIDAVKAQERAAKSEADGLECWIAVSHLQTALRAVLTWHQCPELYGRLIAQQQWQSEYLQEW